MEFSRVNIIRRLIAKIIGHINTYCTVILTCSTLLAYAANYVSPLDFKLPSYFGLMFPYILIADFTYIVLLLIVRKNNAFFLIGIVLLGWRCILATVQANPLHFFSNDDETTDSSFSIMSFNVRLLDRYNWIKGKNDTRTKIFEFLKYESPDIVCFQEFYNRNNDSLDNRTQVKQILQATSVVTDASPDGKHDLGYVIFSKYQLSNSQKIYDQDNKLIGISADANINGKKVRILNVHLKSIKLGYNDYNFIDSLDRTKKIEQLSGFKSIFTKMDNAYIQRISQAKVINLHISKSPYPLILCGDFNEPPISYCYKKITENINDAFVESGLGFGTTMRLKFFIFRIDYILHTKNLKSSNFVTHNERLSDHYAISCKITLSN